MNKMRVSKWMNDTRNEEIWELLLSIEVIKENIEDLTNKLAEEKSKFNKLLDETIELKRTEEILIAEIDHLTKENNTNNEEIKALQDSINDLSTKVDAASASVIAGR